VAVKKLLENDRCCLHVDQFFIVARFYALQGERANGRNCGKALIFINNGQARGPGQLAPERLRFLGLFAGCSIHIQRQTDHYLHCSVPFSNFDYSADICLSVYALDCFQASSRDAKRV